MSETHIISQIILYVLMLLMGLYSFLVLLWQANVRRGKAMKNPDGTFDSWHEQRIFYGIAFADLVLACPLSIIGIVVVFIWPQTGILLLSLVSFWFVWANIMTTATSLKFEEPKITVRWFVAFPFGILIGLSFIIWVFFHYEMIFIR